MSNKVVLIGGFLKSISLAKSLVNKGYKVTVINNNYNDCLKIAENNQLNVIYGDGTRAYVLEDAMVYENDIAIALTKRDEDNLVISELCKKKFGVSKTVSLVNDQKKIDFFYKMGIDSVVCSSSIITGILEKEAFIDKIKKPLPIGHGNICVSEVFISGTAPVLNKKLRDINLPQEVIIACILRKEKNLIPTGETEILEKDIIVLISSIENEADAFFKLTGRLNNE